MKGSCSKKLIFKVWGFCRFSILFYAEGSWRRTRRRRMVVVANNPETVPMLDDAGGGQKQEPLLAKQKKNPLTEEAYKNITSSMRAEPLQIESPKTALELLSTAIQLQNMPLVHECIKNLDEHLDRDNVLMIYSHLSKCKMPTVNRNEFEPSAPPIIENENHRGTDWVQEPVNNLRHNCLLVIDKEANYVLKNKKEIVDLTYVDIYNILSRDSLEVSSEMLVYCAMCNWGMAECSRMTLNPLHLQEVLRQLRFAPRYGLMSKKEFTCRKIGSLKGPTNSGILDEKEWRLIKFYIEQRAKRKSVNELEHKMSTPRRTGRDKPKILSDKSCSRYEHCSLYSGSSTSSRRWERWLINILACWTAIFD